MISPELLFTLFLFPLVLILKRHYDWLGAYCESLWAYYEVYAESLGAYLESLWAYYESLLEAPALPPNPTWLARVRYVCHRAYHLYLVTLPGYGLDPGERLVLDTFMLVLLSAVGGFVALLGSLVLRLVLRVGPLFMRLVLWAVYIFLRLVLWALYHVVTVVLWALDTVTWLYRLW